MKKFTVEDSFWHIFPDAKIGAVVCRGVDNSARDHDRYKEMLMNAENAALKYLKNPTLSKNDVVKVWREAFKKFKTKKGARSSIESLVTCSHHLRFA
nr:hypothetical protein [Thermovirga lienii]